MITGLLKHLYVTKNGQNFVKYLRKKGVEIGEGSTFYDPKSNVVDLTRPYLIKIGKYVKITHGVIMLTHDFSWSVIKKKYHHVLGSAGEIIVGDNVFIGMNSIILNGVHIGNNVIIGANSLINKDIPSNVVVAGSPAKVIMTIEDYYRKREALQLDEAKKIVYYYRERYKTNPPLSAFDEFLWLFKFDESELPEKFVYQLERCGNYNETIEKYKNDYHLFDSFDELLTSD